MTGTFNTNTASLYADSSDGSGNLFKGVIDEPAVYNSALSSTRVGVHHEKGK